MVVSVDPDTGQVSEPVDEHVGELLVRASPDTGNDK